MRLLALSLVLGGCTSTIASAGTAAPNRYQLFASGYLGCRAQDVAITEHTSDSSGAESWVAECGGRRYVCGGWVGSTVHCAELVAR